MCQGKVQRSHRLTLLNLPYCDYTDALQNNFEKFDEYKLIIAAVTLRLKSNINYRI